MKAKQPTLYSTKKVKQSPKKTTRREFQNSSPNEMKQVITEFDNLMKEMQATVQASRAITQKNMILYIDQIKKMAMLGRRIISNCQSGDKFWEAFVNLKSEIGIFYSQKIDVYKEVISAHLNNITKLFSELESKSPRKYDNSKFHNDLFSNFKQALKNATDDLNCQISNNEDQNLNDAVLSFKSLRDNPPENIDPQYLKKLQLIMARLFQAISDLRDSIKANSEISRSFLSKAELLQLLIEKPDSLDIENQNLPGPKKASKAQTIPSLFERSTSPQRSKHNAKLSGTTSRPHLSEDKQAELNSLLHEKRLLLGQLSVAQEEYREQKKRLRLLEETHGITVDLQKQIAISQQQKKRYQEAKEKMPEKQQYLSQLQQEVYDLNAELEGRRQLSDTASIEKQIASIESKRKQIPKMKKKIESDLLLANYQKQKQFFENFETLFGRPFPYQRDTISLMQRMEELANPCTKSLGPLEIQSLRQLREQQEKYAKVMHFSAEEVQKKQAMDADKFRISTHNTLALLRRKCQSEVKPKCDEMKRTVDRKRWLSLEREIIKTSADELEQEAEALHNEITKLDRVNEARIQWMKQLKEQDDHLRAREEALLFALQGGQMVETINAIKHKSQIEEKEQNRALKTLKILEKSLGGSGNGNVEQLIASIRDMSSFGKKLKK